MSAASRSWLEGFAAHPVFADAGSIGADTTRRASLLAVRGTDLIAVVENEVRITSLAQAKRTLSGGDESALAYKVLANEHLDFGITQVLVNPTGKLLAVAGTHELVMLILPRRGYMQHVGQACPVKGMRVGAYYHAPHGCAALAQCGWHPLGRDGASLLALTEDGLVREYDVLRDVDEPQQTIACTPGASARRSAFSADDDEAGVAVAYALGDTDAAMPDADDLALAPSWLFLTLFVLMRNGDVWAICPFLPKRASVPSARIAALQDDDGLAKRYVADLVKQLPDEDTSLDGERGMANVTAPASVPHRAVPQGPFLLRPAPVDRNDEEAAVASDVFAARLPAPLGTSAAPLDVLGIGARDGTIQLCLLAEPIAPRWARAAPPTLVVYETIVLPLDSPARTYAALQDENVLAFVQDPLYPDTVFVTHMLGVHRISMQRWAEPLLEAIAAGRAAEALAAKRTSEVVCVAQASDAAAAAHITGAVLVNDVYLSYAFFALTVDAQLIALELGLRTPAEPVARESEGEAYVALLTDAFHAPKFALRAPAASSAPLAVSAESLRAFGRTAEHVRGEVRDVVSGANATQSRLEQQVQEAQRQVAELGGLAKRLDALGTPSGLAERLARIEAAQRATIERTDALLQQLMDEHQPQLSIYERRWLDELQRMAREFGVGDAPAPPAAEQLRRLEHQLGVLRPSLPRYAEQQRRAAPQGQRLGTQQTQRVESLLANEARLLAQAKVKIQKMQLALRAG